MTTAIPSNLSYYSNGYYYTTDGQAIPANSQASQTSSTYLTASQPDTVQLSTQNSSETCTDGKDDGKIGFGGAIGNAVKGIAKTIVNGVKGMFTDENGNFSFGKTLLSVGTAALCIAVPAVGVAACAVGAVAGAVQVGKGIYGAATADTDAEAKEAWQNIGGGTFTVASSVVGAKAGMKAVGKSSTAAIDDVAKAASKAIENADDVATAASKIDYKKFSNGDEVQAAVEKLNNVDDILTTIKTKGKASAYDQLDKSASFGQKASAMAKDIVSSTKNNAKTAWTKGRNALENKVKTSKDYNALKKLQKAKDKALEKQNSGETLTADDLKAISDWKKFEQDKSQYTQDAIAKLNKKTTDASLKQNIKDATTKADKKAKRAEYDAFKKENSLLNKAKNAISETADKSKTWTEIKKLTQGEKQGLINTTKNILHNIHDGQLANIAKGLPADGQAILKALTSGKTNLDNLTKQYGWENVLQVLEAIWGTQVTSETI